MSTIAATTSAFLSGALPAPRTRLIGREAELVTARSLLLDEAVPLLTLVGPGGVGKTRLALAIAGDIADHFLDGMVWIDLAPLADPALVAMSVAAALDISPTPGTPPVEEISRALRSRQQLLLFDNCEHVLSETATLISRVLTACPAVQVLATSRAPLRVEGERELATEPLPLPADSEPADSQALRNNASVRLFVERARAIVPGLLAEADSLVDIAEICRRLDGLPLAIELAAGRTRIFPPEVLRTRLERRLPMLTVGRRDAPARQQTIRDTIGWSYDLLVPDEQALFRRLCVFTSGFNLEAAQAVSSGSPSEDIVPVLERLVEQNLVRRLEARGEPRFTMLETIREFGLEHLARSGEEDDARDRHAAYFLTLVERLDANVFEHLPEAAQVLARLQTEYPNLRAALARFKAAGDAESFVRLAGIMHAFWINQGYIQEGQRWLEQAIAIGASASLPARVWAQIGMAGMVFHQEGVPKQTMALVDEAVTLARLSGDTLAIALATEWYGNLATMMGNFEVAEACLVESRTAFAALPRQPWIARNLSFVEAGFGRIAFARGDLDAAESISIHALECMRALEREHAAPYLYASEVLTTLGRVARARGDHGVALAHFQEALRQADQTNDVFGVVYALIPLASTLPALGRRVEAARLFGAAEAYCERRGLRFDAYLRASTQQGTWSRPDDAVQPSGPGETATTWVMDMFGLADQALQSQWTAGRNMPLEVAVAEALAINPLDSISVPGLPIPDTKHRAYGLTERECEVLSLLCERLTDPEIAGRLFISRRTVSTHVVNLFNKLGVNSRRAAAAPAVREGLV